MGEAGEGQMITHQQKKMGLEALRNFVIQFPHNHFSDAKIEEIPFLKLDEKARKYLEERAARSAGPDPPQRRAKSTSLDVPKLDLRCSTRQHPRACRSTTMAFVRILNTLLREQNIGKFVVPIVPDESRTFGMEEMFWVSEIFSQVGVSSSKPQDADQAHVLPGRT